MILRRVLWMVVLALPVAGCSRAEEWIEIGYVSPFDPLSETHAFRTLKNMEIEWRPGKQGWRGYYVEIRKRDAKRAIAALMPDEVLGNIDFLVDTDHPQLKVESIRRAVLDFVKEPRIADDPLLSLAFRHEELKKLTASFRYVKSFGFRARICLGEDHRLHTLVEGKMELVAELDEEVAGHRLKFTVNGDDKTVEIETTGSWWKGEPEVVRRNMAKYGVTDQRR